MKIEEQVPLAPFTTFKIGGKADYLCFVKTEDELSSALEFARKRGLPILVLGSGSNVLIGDEGFRGLVIKMEIKAAMFDEEGSNVIVTAGAGEEWDKLVSALVAKGLWGLENLSAIPGTVGASPVQNIGAYGREVADFIIAVNALDKRNGLSKKFSNAECGFGYRESFFKTAEGRNFIITSVAFRLCRDPKPDISYKDLKEYFAGKTVFSLKDIRKAVIEIRSKKFPDLSEFGTAGSFWKNPVISKERFADLQKRFPDMPSFPSGDMVKIPLAWILDKVCDLKGSQKGRAALWKNQPLVVVAEKDATSKEVRELALYVSQKVKEKTGIDIEREVEYI